MSAMERRIVAVMFTDLVRSTELFDRLSAQQAEGSEVIDGRRK